jgi:hypothetical protein
MTYDYVAIERQAERDRHLYDKYGKPLEVTHTGQFVAIGLSGEVILGDNDVQVLDQALAAFGRGNFAFRRVGPGTERRWRSLAP